MKNHANKTRRSPRWKRTVINTAVVMSLAALYAPTVAAYDVLVGGADAIVTNGGTITATASAASALAAPIGALTGGGSLSASSVQYGPSRGDLVDGDSFINSAAITVQSTSSLGTASAYGMSAGNLGIGASITNSGSISAGALATGSGLSANATAYGLATGNLGKGASIVNSDAITVTATANNLASAYGIAAADLSGKGADIINNGTINATAISANNSASAYGISAYALLETNTAIVNNGVIIAAATANMQAGANGIYANNLRASASITNNGTISATAKQAGNFASTAARPSALGLSVLDMGAAATITNSGSISATATGYSWAVAYGIDAQILTGSTITNSGSIVATAKATYAHISSAPPVAAYGIDAVSLEAGASIVNSSTITVTATGNNSAHAYGIATGNLGLNASITNNATQTISATAVSAAGSATAYGISAGILTGTDATLADHAAIANDGTIDATATGYSLANAYGIYVGNFAGGGTTATYPFIINNGTITATAHNTFAGNANAYGIYTADLTGMDATILNAGTITAAATATLASAYGISAGALSGDWATLTNSRVIDVTATSSAASIGSYALAYGIKAGNLGISARISNSDTGIITVLATANNLASAYGIAAAKLSGNGADIINNGTINATAISANNAASAYGIFASDLLAINTAIVNNGVIIAAATANMQAGANGIYAGKLYASASITNNGTISATAKQAGNFASTAAYPAALGISVLDMGAAAAITNSGSISATATGYSWAVAYGIDAGILTGSTITNNGSIVATAKATHTSSAPVEAYGIDTFDLEAGASIVNSSTITVTASGYSSAFAYGMSAVNLTGASIVNSGTITATAVVSPGAGGSAVGIRVDNLDVNSTITNSGTITTVGPSAASAKAYSIYAATGAGVVANSGTLNGNLYLGGSVTLNNTGALAIPSSANGGSKAHIGGSYSQTGANAVFQTGVINTTAYGMLDVIGAAELANGSVIKVALDTANTLANNNVLDNVIHAGGLTTGTSIIVKDNSLKWKFIAANDGNNGIDLTAIDTGITSLSSLSQAAGSAATVGIAGAIDTLLGGAPTGGMAAAFEELTSLGSGAEMTQALLQFNPVLGGAAAQSTADILRSGATAVVHEQMQDTYGLSSGEVLRSDSANWIKPFGSWARQKDRNSASGYKANSYGLVAGTENRVSDQRKIGGALSYSASKVSSNSVAHSVDMKTYQLALYATDRLNDVTSLNLQFAIGVSRNTSQRSITIGVFNDVAQANYNSLHTMLNAELERAYRLSNRTTVVPSVGMEYVNIKVKSYTETGSSAFTVNGQSQNALILSAGGKMLYKLTDETKLTSHLHLGYDTVAKQSTITSTFTNGGPTFVTNGIKPPSAIMRAGLGYEVEKANGTEIATRYDMEKKSGYINHMLSVNYRALF